jgi:hypothetical protein
VEQLVLVVTCIIIELLLGSVQATLPTIVHLPSGSHPVPVAAETRVLRRGLSPELLLAKTPATAQTTAAMGRNNLVFFIIVVINIDNNSLLCFEGFRLPLFYCSNNLYSNENFLLLIY